MPDLLWMHLTQELFQLVAVLLSTVCTGEDASGAHAGFVSGRAHVNAYSTDARSHVGARNVDQITLCRFRTTVSGNLGGQIVVLLPLVLSGIVHVNAHQVSVTVQLALERSLSGSPSIRIVGCSASVGYVDAYIQNGGLIGDICSSPQCQKPKQQSSAVVLHGLQLMRTRRVAPMAIPLPGNPCAGCPDPENKEQLNAVQDLLKALDIVRFAHPIFGRNKLSDIVLTTQILRTYATPNDYTVELNGEFSPSGRGGTPFSPFAMYFPQAVGNSMADALLSDFTINSLIYQMQKKGFISFRVGPETPKIGELLKTTCADDDYSSESFEDPGVEIDDEGESTTEVTTTETSALRRRKREEGDDDGEEALLADLGICIGDIMPAMVNDALANGFTVDVPTSGLPVSFVRPQIRIVDHAILFSADLIVSASLLGTDGESKACRNQK
uniref:Lipid-binding serum glycoprotein C-terminal domain-containing protein n=1 Tax=Parascaris equorum TaxID=6256 RepID=A0A914SEG7_PAREQ